MTMTLTWEPGPWWWHRSRPPPQQTAPQLGPRQRFPRPQTSCPHSLSSQQCFSLLCMGMWLDGISKVLSTIRMFLFWSFLCFAVFAMQNSLANWQTQVARLSLSWTTVCHPAAPQLSFQFLEATRWKIHCLFNIAGPVPNNRAWGCPICDLSMHAIDGRYGRILDMFEWLQNTMSPSHKLGCRCMLKEAHKYFSSLI